MILKIKTDKYREYSESIFRFFITGVRILIGWHFLYEGLSKAFSENWSSMGYLLKSNWLLSGFFQWITSNPTVLKVVDQLNIWGLILIGLGLFFGCLTRAASCAGIILILLYYIANPPLIGYMSEATGEGHYLIVNKNLIELSVLFLFVLLPKYFLFGIDRWLFRIRTKESKEKINKSIIKNQDQDETQTQKKHDTNRRELLKDLISLPFFGSFVYAALKKRQWESFEERHLISQPSRTEAVTGASPDIAGFSNLQDLKAKVPLGKIKEIEISRIICGGNLISGFAHSRDLIYVSSLIQNYFSDERVLGTLHLCEACGINTATLRIDKNTLRIIEKYRKRGGKIQWLAQAKIQKDDIRSDIDAAIDNGAIGIFIHGGVGDHLVSQGRVDLLCKSVEYIKSHNIIAGIAAHSLEVPVACEKAGANPDFYMKTLNSGNYWTAGPRIPKYPNWKPDPRKIVEPEFMEKVHDNIWSITPQQTIEFMKDISQPWIAYKVLGAGAIHPEQGFKYVFENGADFACVGMFDFQIVENCNIINDLLSGELTRTRAWRA